MALQIEFKNGWRLHSTQVSKLLRVPHSKIKLIVQNNYKLFNDVGWGIWTSKGDFFLEQCHIELLIIHLFESKVAQDFITGIHSEFVEFKTHQVKSSRLF